MQTIILISFPQKSFQFLSSIKIPDGNASLVWDTIDGKTTHSSTIEYSSDNKDKHKC